jgi:membrane-associated phospholipid phosphatase
MYCPGAAACRHCPGRRHPAPTLTLPLSYPAPTLTLPLLLPCNTAGRCQTRPHRIDPLAGTGMAIFGARRSWRNRCRPFPSVQQELFIQFSLPSGHTTEALALASVISSHYEEIWVSCSSYSVAGLVGKIVVAHNKSLCPGKVVLLPEITTGSIGMRLTSNF